MKLFCHRLNTLRWISSRYDDRESCSEGDNCPYEHDWADVDLCEYVPLYPAHRIPICFYISSYRRLWVRNICRRPRHMCEMRHFYFEGEKEKLNDRRNRDQKKKVSEVPICR